MSRDCPLILVLCDFHVVGCQARLTRRDMPSHISENLTGHMSLLQVHMMTHPGENMATYLWLMVGSIQKVVLDNATIRSELHGAQEILQDTRDELQQSRVQQQETRDKLQEVHDKLQETRDELRGACETVAELETSGVSQQEQIENLQREIDICQEENMTLQQQKDDLTERLRASEQKMQALDTQLHEKMQQTSTQLQATVTAHEKETTAALNQHKRESDKKLRAAREEFSKNLTASEHQIQTALDTQMTQQKHELAEIHTQISVLTQTSTQLQATVTAHKKETTTAQHSLDQHKRESNEKLKAAKDELSRKLTASEHAMQTALNTQQAALTQQKNELTEKLSASEQKLQATLATQQTTITKCRDENRRLQQSLTEKERKQLESEAKVMRVRDDLTRKITASEQKIQTQEATLNQHQKTLEKVMCTGTLPFEFTMTKFEKHKRASDEWFSPPFYTHTHGYRMCINVDANGCGLGKGTHVSIFTCIMRGPFDADLKWPFRGDVTIQIVNQAGEDNHQERVIHYTDQTPDVAAGRVTDKERSVARGIFEFLPHSSLGYNAASNTQYLRGDSLRIRISKVELKN